jgi:hypothetical protein
VWEKLAFRVVVVPLLQSCILTFSMFCSI